MLNDYIHVLREHNDVLEDVYERITKFKSCDIANCAHIVRHHTNRNIKNSNKNEKETASTSTNYRVQFYKVLLAAMHCYFLHSFDVGLRIRRSAVSQMNDQSDNKDDNHNEDENDKCHEPIFKNIKRAMDKRRTKMRKLSDFNHFENNKFSMDCNEEDKTEYESPLETDKTFTDGFLTFTKNNISSHPQIPQLNS